MLSENDKVLFISMLIIMKNFLETSHPASQLLTHGGALRKHMFKWT
jgi:hypothetical protein